MTDRCIMNRVAIAHTPHLNAMQRMARMLYKVTIIQEVAAE